MQIVSIYLYMEPNNPNVPQTPKVDVSVPVSPITPATEPTGNPTDPQSDFMKQFVPSQDSSATESPLSASPDLANLTGLAQEMVVPPSSEVKSVIDVASVGEQPVGENNNQVLETAPEAPKTPEDVFKKEIADAVDRLIIATNNKP